MRKPIFVVLSFAVLVIGLAVVVGRVAAHGGDSNLIHACVNDASGEIKIVDANDTCPNSSTALDWNPQHPIVVLPGENGVDLSGLACDPQILFSDTASGLARLVYECGEEAFSFRVPDGLGADSDPLRIRDGFLGVSGSQGGLIMLNPDHVDGNEPVIWFGPGFARFGGHSPDPDRWYFANSNDDKFLALERGILDFTGGQFGQNLNDVVNFVVGQGVDVRTQDFQVLLGVRDGLIDLSGMSGDVVIRPKTGQQLRANDGTTELFNFAQAVTELPSVFFGSPTPMLGLWFVDSTATGNGGGIVWDGDRQEWGFFGDIEAEGGFLFINDRRLDLSEMSGTPRIHVANDLAFSNRSGEDLLTISEGLLDSSKNDIKGKIYTQDGEPDIADGSFAFWEDTANGKVYTILDIGGTQFKTEMTPTGSP